VGFERLVLRELLRRLHLFPRARVKHLKFDTTAAYPTVFGFLVNQYLGKPVGFVSKAKFDLRWRRVVIVGIYSRLLEIVLVSTFEIPGVAAFVACFQAKAIETILHHLTCY
jgi:hypothetical protein